MNDSFRAAVERSAEIDARIATHPEEFRMMTGDRPTGTLHIGHYFGSIANRLRLQEYGAETWVLVADYQVITDREVGDDIAAASATCSPTTWRPGSTRTGARSSRTPPYPPSTSCCCRS